MPVVRAKIIASIRTSCSGRYGVLTWEWVLRADGRVSYRLSEVSGKRERNPWSEVTQLPPAGLQAARDPGEAEAVLTRLAGERGQQRSHDDRQAQRAPGETGGRLRWLDGSAGRHSPRQPRIP